MAFQLPPNPKFQQFDTNGNPLTGGKLYTYLAGSSDPVSTYTDSSGATANTNPVILDARGEADVWISDNVIYKFVLTDASDVEIWSVDNISAAAGGSGGGGGNDEFVRVTGADLASQYLSEKMAAGTGISLNVLNAGGVEQLQIVSSADLQGVTDNGAITTNNITVGPNFTLTGGGELGAIALSSTKTNITNINNSGLTIDNLSGSGGASSVLLSTTGSLQAGSPGQNLIDIYLAPTIDKGSVYTGLRGVAVDTSDSNRLVEYDIPIVPTNYVTTDTTQTITGIKTFEVPVELKNGAPLRAYDLSGVRFYDDLDASMGFIYREGASDSLYIQAESTAAGGLRFDSTNGIFPLGLSDNGADYTNLKMMAWDTSNSKWEVADIPDAAGTSQQIDSSGIKSGAVITASGGSTTWDLGVGEAYIMDYSDPLNIKPKHITWTAQTGLTLTNLLTQPRTNVAIALDNTARPDVSFTNSFTGTIDGVSGTIYIAEKSVSNFDSEETRLFAPIGRIVHTNQTTISFPVQLQQHTESVLSSYLDFVNLFPAQNVEGNNYTPTAGVNLSVDKSAGKGFRFGSNYTTDLDNPNIQDIPLASPTTHFYRYQDGAGGFTQTASTTVLDVAQYDNGTGTLASVNNNQWTIQPVWVFAGSGTMFVQYGQELFSSKASAIEALATFNPVLDDNLTSDAVFRGYFIVRGGGTDTNNTGDFEWRSPLSERGGGTGTSVVVDLQTAYESSFDPEIVTDATRGALTVKRGSALDTDNVIEVQNGAGTTNFSVDGNGDVSGTTFNGVALTAGGSATNFLAADGTYKDASTAPGGSDTQIQFNDGGAFGGASAFTYDKASSEVSLDGVLRAYKVFIEYLQDDSAVRDHQIFVRTGTGGSSSVNSQRIYSIGDGALGVDEFGISNWITGTSTRIKQLYIDNSDNSVHLPSGRLSVADRIISFNESNSLIDGLLSIRGTDDDPAGKTFLGLKQQSSTAILVAGAVSPNITANPLELWTSNSSGVESARARFEDGLVTIKEDMQAEGKLNLASTTNATPTNGDIWYDGTNTQVESPLKVNDDVLGTEIRAYNQESAANIGLTSVWNTDGSTSSQRYATLKQQATYTTLTAGSAGIAATNELRIEAADSSGVEQLVAIFKNNTVNLPNLPTSSVGLSAGDLWNDSGTLKIA